MLRSHPVAPKINRPAVTRFARKWLPILAAVAVMLVALGLRWRAANRLPVDHDEYTYLSASRYDARALQKGMPLNILQSNENYEHPGLAKLVYGLAIYASRSELIPVEKKYFIIGERMLPSNPMLPMLLLARHEAAIFGTLAAVLLALINPAAGLLLAVHTFAIKYTSVAYLEALPSFTSLVCVLAYQRFCQSARASRTRLGWLGLSALALGFSSASKYIYATAGIAVAIHFLWNSVANKQFSFRRAALLAGWGITALLVFFAADPYLWLDPFHRLAASLAYNSQFSNSAYVASFGYSFWQPLVWLSKSVPAQDPAVIPSLPRDFLISADLPITLLAILGFPRLARKQGVYALWLVTCLVFLLSWPTRWAQYVVILLAPLCLSAAEGLNTLLMAALLLFRRLMNLRMQGR